METVRSVPIDWMDKDVTGFVINAAFSDYNASQILAWLEGVQAIAPKGVYAMKREGLHVTVLDWVAPLFDYSGTDKRALYNKLRPAYDGAFRRITRAMPVFSVNFDEVRVTPSTIILIGHDTGQFQSLREQFTKITALPEGGKQPPTIVHSSIARFIPPEIDLEPVTKYARTHPLQITQRVDEFRLVETRKEPMQDFSVLEKYSLQKNLIK